MTSAPTKTENRENRENLQEHKPKNLFNPRAEKPVDPVVFSVALGLILVFVVLGAIYPDKTGKISTAALDWVLARFGWLFILAVAFFVAFTLFLAISRYGRIPLGRADEKPEFSTGSWIALMFGGGMGVGLVFFGVAEPISHMMGAKAGSSVDRPPGSGVHTDTLDAARIGMQYSFFHWGIQPWAIYSVVGLALAYSTYRKGRGNLLSAPFTPAFGNPERWWGKIINIFAIVVTKFGSATSLGLAGLEIAAGVSYVFGLKPTNTNTVIIIVIMTGIFVITAVSGVAKGMKHASNLNLVLAFVLMIFVLAVGPTVFILNVFARSTGDYLFNYITMTFHTAGFTGGKANSWLQTWTIFYWAWWISWALHVGTFLARVSRGRTIRQFVAGAVIIPSLGSFVWFSIIGGAGEHLQLVGKHNIAAAQKAGGEAASFFSMLQAYPWFTATGIIGIALVAIFFITGADTGAIVLGTLSSHGIPEPRRLISAIWGCTTAAVAIVLILVGGLDAIQTFVILAASPFMIIMGGMAVAFFMDLRHDPLRQSIRPPVRKHAPDLFESPEESEEEAAMATDGGSPTGPAPGEVSETPMPATTRDRPANNK
jgi:choline/carnitine/betaine transport